MATSRSRRTIEAFQDISDDFVLLALRNPDLAGQGLIQEYRGGAGGVMTEEEVMDAIPVINRAAGDLGMRLDG